MHHSMYTRVPTLISDAFNLHDSAVKSEPGEPEPSKLSHKSPLVTELSSDNGDSGKSCDEIVLLLRFLLLSLLGDVAKGNQELNCECGEPSCKSALSSSCKSALSYIYPNLLYNVSIWLASTLQSSK